MTLALFASQISQQSGPGGRNSALDQDQVPGSATRGQELTDGSALFCQLLSVAAVYGSRAKRGALTSFSAETPLFLEASSSGSSLDFSGFSGFGLSTGLDLSGLTSAGLLGSFSGFGLSAPLLDHQSTHFAHQPIPATHSYSYSREFVGVPAPYHVPVTVTRNVPVPVPQPYPVEVPQPHPVLVPHPVPVEVPRPVRVPVTKAVPVPVPQPVHVPVLRPVHVPVPHPVAVEVRKAVPVPQPVPVPVPKPVIHKIVHEEPEPPTYAEHPPSFSSHNSIEYSSRDDYEYDHHHHRK
ncbi:UNVERIFIED_CONTAM: hypothetical protein PYX00_009221 [Menopon gallinae]|uniref:Uncharacterized protein n=1 Tax=Menopon gallinae TaxID=328185 RepID=A0AAW2HAT0_9NEOP